VETPDQRVNQAIAWAQFALDQAWACNPDLGCGYVAGYGPDRGARRPQYDWFFAGMDSQPPMRPLLKADHARDELTIYRELHDRRELEVTHRLQT